MTTSNGYFLVESNPGGVIITPSMVAPPSEDFHWTSWRCEVLNFDSCSPMVVRVFGANGLISETAISGYSLSAAVVNATVLACVAIENWPSMCLGADRVSTAPEVGLTRANT